MEQYDYSAEQIVAKKTPAKEAEVKKKKKKSENCNTFCFKRDEVSTKR
jgi:hypothetical protein